MKNEHPSDRATVVARIADIIRRKVNITVHSPRAESTEVSAVVGEKGIYLAVENEGAVHTALFNDPSVDFDVTVEDTRLSGNGRAVILETFAAESDARSAFSEASLNVPDNTRIIQIIPHEVCLTDEVGTETLEHPFGQRPPGAIAKWWQASRPFAYTASVTPMVLGAVLAWYLDNDAITWWLLPFIIAAGVFYHAGANLVSDYFDYKRGVDRFRTMGGSRVLTDGYLAPIAVLRGGVILFVIGTLLGLWMVTFRGMPLLWLGIAGLVGGFFYGGWPIEFKYRGLGEAIIFTLFGPLMVIGSYYVLTGSFSRDVLLISLPVGFLVAAIVQANNLRDIADDTTAGIVTISNTVGQSLAAVEYYVMVVCAYLSVVLMIAFGILPLWTLIVAISAIPASKIVNIIRSAGGRHTSELALIDQMAAQVHLLFGVLLMIGIILGKLI